MAKAKARALEKVRVVNRLTGELFDFEYDPTDPAGLKVAKDEIKAMRDELDKLEDVVKASAVVLLERNDFKPLDAGDGYEWRFMSPVRKSYSFPTVRQYIDEDLLISRGVVTIANGKLEDVLKELVAENGIEPGAWQAIQESAETKATKPFPKLERVV